MKKSTTFGIMGALLLLPFGAIAYAQPFGMMNGYNTNNEITMMDGYANNQGFTMMKGNINIDQMEAMHDVMTQNLDPQLKAQMDAMHDSHINAIKNGNTQTGTFGMMNGNQRVN